MYITIVLRTIAWREYWFWRWWISGRSTRHPLRVTPSSVSSLLHFSVASRTINILELLHSKTNGFAKFSNLQTLNCRNLQIYQLSNLQIQKFENIQVQLFPRIELLSRVENYLHTLVLIRTKSTLYLNINFIPLTDNLLTTILTILSSQRTC